MSHDAPYLVRNARVNLTALAGAELNLAIFLNESQSIVPSTTRACEPCRVRNGVTRYLLPRGRVAVLSTR